MRKTTFLLLFALVWAHTGFSQNPDALLMRRWKMTKIMTQKMLDNAESGLPKSQEVIDEETMVQNLIDKGSYIDIKKNNVFIMGMYNFIADEILPIKTQWDYLDNKKAFNVKAEEAKKVVKNKKGTKLTATNSMDYTEYRILELSDTVLKLRVEKVGETKPNTIMIFSPVK